jgi:hypothetical protein
MKARRWLSRPRVRGPQGDRPLARFCKRFSKLLKTNVLDGARWWIRTTDPRRVKAVLYR